MIFVTVGGQGAFDRMIRVVDDWAGEPGRPRVFAQVGPTKQPPRHLEWTEFLTPSEFRRRMQDAELIVSHAGMGTIIAALELTKPIVVMPRRACFGEQRNDHQVDTARRLRELAGIAVAEGPEELRSWLERLSEVSALRPLDGRRRAGILEAVRRAVDAS